MPPGCQAVALALSAAAWAAPGCRPAGSPVSVADGAAGRTDPTNSRRLAARTDNAHVAAAGPSPVSAAEPDPDGAGAATEDSGVGDCATTDSAPTEDTSGPLETEAAGMGTAGAAGLARRLPGVGVAAAAGTEADIGSTEPPRNDRTEEPPAPSSAPRPSTADLNDGAVRTPPRTPARAPRTAPADDEFPASDCEDPAAEAPAEPAEPAEPSEPPRSA